MKEKSLRQIAKELGVSASYLSQVRHGKSPASQKVLSSAGLPYKRPRVIIQSRIRLHWGLV